MSFIAISVATHSRAWCVPMNSTLGRAGESVPLPILAARSGRPSRVAPIESRWITVSAAAHAARVARIPTPGLSNDRNDRNVSAAAGVGRAAAGA
jgi:hypothetical protein